MRLWSWLPRNTVPQPACSKTLSQRVKISFSDGKAPLLLSGYMKLPRRRPQ